MDRLKLLKDNYDQAVEFIQFCSEIPEMKDFVKWILTIYDCDFHFAFPCGFFRANTSAQGMASFLSVLLDAIRGDSQSFYIVEVGINRQPKLVTGQFRNEDEIKRAAIEQDGSAESDLGVQTPVKILDNFALNDFPALFNQWKDSAFERRFLRDVRVFGVNDAKCYNPQFKEEWLVEYYSSSTPPIG